MHAVMIALRLLHILLGVFWAGTLFFIVTFLEPSVRAAGPEGGLAAIVAFVVGVFVMRAAALRAGALGQSLEQLAPGCDPGHGTPITEWRSWRGPARSGAPGSLDAHYCQ